MDIVRAKRSARLLGDVLADECPAHFISAANLDCSEGNALEHGFDLKEEIVC